MIFEQDEKVTLYVLFTKQDGSAATISGTPTITIYHVVGASVKTDVNATNMTQLNGSLYYYEHYINAGADKTTYVARYSGTYSDGTVVVASDTFYVVPNHFYDKGTSGLLQKTIVRNEWTKEEKDSFFSQLKKLTNILSEINSIRNSLADTTIQYDDKTGKITNELAEIKKQFSSISNKMEKSISLLSENVSQTGEKIYSSMPSVGGDPVIISLRDENLKLKEKLVFVENMIQSISGDIKNIKTPIDNKLNSIESKIMADRENIENRLSVLEDEIVEVGKLIAKIVPIE